MSSSEENIKLPICYNRLTCSCYSTILNSKPKNTETEYFLKNYQWLKTYLEEVNLHSNKSLLLGNCEQVNGSTICCTYIHLFTDIEIISQWCLKSSIPNSIIKTPSGKYFPLQFYLSIFRALSKSYFELYHFCFDDEKKFHLMHLQQSLDIHIFFIKCINEIL